MSQQSELPFIAGEEMAMARHFPTSFRWGAATAHFPRVEEDTALLPTPGLNAYRFSLSWPRILPLGSGEVQTRWLDFYERLVDTFLAQSIEPFVTLYHRDLPAPLRERGGWVQRETAYAFAEFAELVTRRLGDRVAHWITLNEPRICALGYGVGVAAPGLADRQDALDAAHHLLLGHGLALSRMRTSLRRGASAGIALNLAQIYAADTLPATQRDLAEESAFYNGWFLDPLLRGRYPDRLFEQPGLSQPPIKDGDLALISARLDFLDIKNDSQVLVGGPGTPRQVERFMPVPQVPGSCLPAHIYAQGLKDLLVSLHRNYPIANLYITERGAACAHAWDQDGYVSAACHRNNVQAQMYACAEALEEGVPLRGYFASLPLPI